METTIKNDTNHKPVFKANPLAKPIRLISYLFPNTVAKYLDQLWATPIKMGKGLYAKSLKEKADHIITTGMTPIYGYGHSEKHVVLMHGWNARGGQLRKFIEPLVQQGFCVWWFDAPGFGDHFAKRSNAYRFSQNLIDVQQQITEQTGHPIHSIIAHSLGCLATLLASDPKLYEKPLSTEKIAWIAPSISPQTMFDSFCNHMLVRKPVKEILYHLVGQDMFEILKEDPWSFFEKEGLFDHLAKNRFLMFDHFDEEVLQSDFKSINERLKPNDSLITDYLGHYKMLKDEKSIQTITNYIKQ